jgi:hypothetical protein
VQEEVILSGSVWLDETFYSVRSEDIVRKDNGNKLKGLSINQLCIGVATDKKNSVLFWKAQVNYGGPTCQDQKEKKIR